MARTKSKEAEENKRVETEASLKRNKSDVSQKKSKS